MQNRLNVYMHGLLIALLMLLAGNVDAENIALFYDSNYVDTSDSPAYGEAYNVKTTLESKGHNVTLLNDVSELTFPTYPGTDILYIPDLEVSVLPGEIAVADYVNDGGTLLINGSGNGGGQSNPSSFLNDTFGFALVKRGSGDSSGANAYLAGGVEQTAFDGGPVSLNIGNNAPINSSIKTATLPPGSLSVYTNDATTQVAIMPYGGGKVIFLSYDWDEAVPNGTTDGGWDSVLDRAISQAGSSSGSSDLSFSLSSPTSTPKEGDFIVYTMMITNLGPSDAQSVAVTNYYPSDDLVFYSGTSTHGECFGGGGEVLCELYTLTSGEVATVTLHFAAKAAGAVTNLAILTSATPDPVLNNNTVSNILTVVSGESNQADLYVNAGVETNMTEVGDWIWFSTTVSNAGPDGALDTFLSSEVLAPGIQGGANSNPDIYFLFFSNGVWYCDIGPLPFGASVTLNTLANRTDPGIVTNIVTVSFSSLDPVPGNNQSMAHYTAVAPPTDLRLSSIPSHQLAEVGDVVSYALSVTNAGPEDATSVVVTNELPTNVSFSGATSSQGSCTNIGNLVICNLGTLLLGNSAELMIDATAVSVGVQTNRASVSMTAADTNPSNNSVLNPLETVPVTDLQLSMSQTTANPIYQGQHINYEVTVSNAGAYAAAAVVVSNRIPDNAAMISAVPSQGATLQNSMWLVSNLGTVWAGSSATLSLELASIYDEIITNSAAVASATADPDNGNNNAALLTGVIHADTDDDGIADWWEFEYFASLGSMTTNSDSDGNGLSDQQEWVVMLNPTNPVTDFIIPAVGQDASNQFIIYWETSPGRSYDILWTSNLVDGFELLTTDLIYPQNSYTDTVHSASDVGIYKIQVGLLDSEQPYNFAYTADGFSLSAENSGTEITFATVSGVTNGSLSIRVGEAISLPNFQNYTFTDISNFGNVPADTLSTSREITVDGDERALNMSLTVQLQPGFVNFAQTGPFVWDLDYGGDRKQLSITMLASGGSGTHNGFIPASATFSEVLDLPIPIINGIPSTVNASDGLTLDGTHSYDPDSTGHIDYYEWDLNYDGIDDDQDGNVFDVGPVGPYLEISPVQLQSMYTSGQSYTIALRITDSNGGMSEATVTFTYLEP